MWEFCGQIQKYKNTEIQKYKNTKIQNYKNTKIQNYKKYEIKSSDLSWRMSCRKSRIKNLLLQQSYH